MRQLLERLSSTNSVHQASLVKVVADTATASAATVGVLTFLGITITSWAQIFTCVWFIILIAKWVGTDVYPVVVNTIIPWIKSKFK